MNKNQYELLLAEQISEYKYDPLGFIKFIFPWNTEGTSLYNQPGPDVWQTDALDRIGKGMLGDPQALHRWSVASAHGCGKSVVIAWLTIWWMSTRHLANVVITANTYTQLTTKTWRELQLWIDLSMNKHWWNVTATKMSHVSNSKWVANAIANSKENSQSLAGTHNKEGVLYLIDEASGIPQEIYDVIYGAMSDKGSLFFTVGNPTKSHGPFFDSFHSQAHRWNNIHVDGRESRFTNKELIQQFIDDYGIDSDIVKVRWLGEFPSASDDTLIASHLVDEAASRTLSPIDFSNYPIVFGVDVARSGSDESVIVRRQGPKVQILGKYLNLDLMKLSNKIVELYRKQMPDQVFVDATGLGAGVFDRLKELQLPVTEVSFGTQAVDKRSYAQTRSELWGLMADWLNGSVEIPGDKDLQTQLKQQTYGYNSRMQIQLVSKIHMKSQGLSSPDIADALACTFYQQSMRTQRRVTSKSIIIPSSVGWS